MTNSQRKSAFLACVLTGLLAMPLAAQAPPAPSKALLEARVTANPRDVEAHVMLAKGHIDAGNPQAALPHLKAAAELRPDAGPLVFQYGITRLETGDVEGAYATLGDLARREPSELATRAYLARSCALLKKPAEAREHLAVVRHGAPSDAMLHAQMVEWTATAAVPEVALEQIAYTLTLPLPSQRKARIYYLQSFAQTKLKQYPQAIESAAMAVELDGSNPQYYVVLLSLQGREGMGNMDVAVLRQAMQRFPVSPDLLLLTGLYNLEMEEYGSVGEVAERLDRVAPGSAELRLLRGHLHLVNFEFEPAASNFLAALEKGMDTPHLHHHLGKALEKSGDFPAALKHYARALEMDPSRPDLLFDLAQLRLSLGEAGLAAQLSERLLPLEPANPRVHKLLADIARRLGKADDARKHLAEFKRLSIAEQATRKAP